MRILRVVTDCLGVRKACLVPIQSMVTFAKSYISVFTEFIVLHCVDLSLN